ncbi:PH (Pleckstrin Homology) domain-containing protein [Prauserella shujinwangii]|uniref:PH (Pleckstrin Homology) domain-containing protein n=1 Tax=Prauserella shujinwangii TaxID=1453103 RepID=A0A2T0LRD2_9PSEU|nr:PH domain-containing protein [Prauserella shujinwangii]PRX46059.1 PH (Pleckstrin Homology) domain-containing protein [Prauserella shujinwangii]
MTRDSVVIRPRRVVWMASVCAVALVAVFVVVALLLRSSDTGVIFQTSDQVAMVGVGLVLAGLTMLFALPRARADAEGIEVRNVVFTRYFRWSEVLSVSFPDGASFARLELPEDEYYSILAVQAVDRHRAVEAVRTLRRLHREAQPS